MKINENWVLFARGERKSDTILRKLKYIQIFFSSFNQKEKKKKTKKKKKNHFVRLE